MQHCTTIRSMIWLNMQHMLYWTQGLVDLSFLQTCHSLLRLHQVWRFATLTRVEIYHRCPIWVSKFQEGDMDVDEWLGMLTWGMWFYFIYKKLLCINFKYCWYTALQFYSLELSASMCVVAQNPKSIRFSVWEFSSLL